MKSEWIKEAVDVPHFEIKIAFLFYFIRDNDMAQLVDKAHYREPLYIPLSDKNILITTRNIFEHLGELIKYYESVIRFNSEYGKELRDSSYFWIRPIIKNLNEGNILASFSWYNTLGEIRYLYNHLTNTAEGEIFYDRDQGWEIIVESYDGKLFIKKSDPDYNQTFCCISVNRQEMLTQMKTVSEKTELMVKQLVEYFGINHWEKRM